MLVNPPQRSVGSLMSRFIIFLYDEAVNIVNIPILDKERKQKKEYSDIISVHGEIAKKSVYKANSLSLSYSPRVL